MDLRRVLQLAAIGGLLLLTAAQVYSGTCAYSVSGSVTPTAPTGTCLVNGQSFTAGATFTLGYEVFNADSTPCTVSATWQQVGYDNAGAGAVCETSFTSTDIVSNVNIGKTGSFSRPRTWTCTAPTNAVSMTVEGDVKYGGSVVSHGSKTYNVNTTCP
jgi:hypothetical protein